MKIKFTFLILTFLLLFSSCNQQDYFNSFLPKEEIKFGKTMLEYFRYKNYDSLLTNMTRDTRIENIYRLAEKHDSIFSSSFILDTIKVVGYNSFVQGSKKDIIITYQYEFKNKITIAVAECKISRNKLKLSRMGFQSIPITLEKLNEFTFSQKSFFHYLIFLLLILQPLFVIGTLIVCIRSDIRHKILWSIIILFSLGKFLFDWSAGVYSFNIFSFNFFFGFGFTSSGPYSPWIINLSIPIGAILFLILRKKLIYNKALHNQRLNADRHFSAVDL